jgi:hypothetical protein
MRRAVTESAASITAMSTKRSNSAFDPASILAALAAPPPDSAKTYGYPVRRIGTEKRVSFRRGERHLSVIFEDFEWR